MFLIQTQAGESRPGFSDRGITMDKIADVASGKGKIVNAGEGPEGPGIYFVGGGKSTLIRPPKDPDCGFICALGLGATMVLGCDSQKTCVYQAALFFSPRGLCRAGGRVTAKAAKELSQRAKRRLAKEYGEVPRSATPTAQGGSAKTGRWWEYKDVNGKTKVVVEHPDGSVHVGIPKPQSTHRTGGPPKYYDYGRFGHIGG